MISAISSGNFRSPLFFFEVLFGITLEIPFVRITFDRCSLNFAEIN